MATFLLVLPSTEKLNADIEHARAVAEKHGVSSDVFDGYLIEIISQFVRLLPGRLETLPRFLFNP